MANLIDTSVYSVTHSQRYLTRWSWQTGLPLSRRTDKIRKYTWPASYSAAEIAIQDPDNLLTATPPWVIENSGDDQTPAALHCQYTEVYRLQGDYVDII